MATDPAKPRKIGPFLLEDELGVGGMGIVYRATYEKNGMKCAVKVLAPDLTANDSVNQRFIRETEILKKLRHPNVIRYFGAGSNRSQRFYAMELIEGGSLDKILKQEGRLSWEMGLEYGLQVARALEHAHAAGIVHRDLKPGNLLVTKEGVLKLSDFGIARDTQATALTQAGKTVGTMAYMAPEQITGKHPISRRTDLYSLGCVLFELLTGRTPFESETQAELLFKHLDEPAPSVREFNQSVPLAFSRLVNELLAKDPSDRPYDALAVEVKLEEIRTKVKEQEKKAQEQATAAGASALTQLYDGKTAQGKKKKRKKKEELAPTPFWERSWFLGLVLVLIVGGVTYAVLSNRSEESLYAKVAPVIASNDPVEWANFESTFETLLRLYPEGKHADEAKQMLDKIAMQRAENSIETRLNLGRDPNTEAERLYVAARQAEKSGDRLDALEKYEAIRKSIKSSPETQPVLNLARRQADKLEDSFGSETSIYERVEKLMTSADPPDWDQAEGDLKVFLVLFPRGRHTKQAQDWMDQIDMSRVERAVEETLKFGREPSSEAERIYLEARQFEMFGDQRTALEKYQSLPKATESTKENRPLLNLARRQAERLKAGQDQPVESLAFLEKQLNLADELFRDGKSLLAQEKWQTIVRLYGRNAKFADVAATARERLEQTREPSR